MDKLKEENRNSYKWQCILQSRSSSKSLLKTLKEILILKVKTKWATEGAVRAVHSCSKCYILTPKRATLAFWSCVYLLIWTYFSIVSFSLRLALNKHFFRSRKLCKIIWKACDEYSIGTFERLFLCVYLPLFIKVISIWDA